MNQMLRSEDNTYYSDNFFSVENGKIINQFTRKSVGVHTRSIQAVNYLDVLKGEKKRGFFAWIKEIFFVPEYTPVRREMKSGGTEKRISLAETMRLLEGKSEENEHFT